VNFSESSCLTLCACFFPKENTRLYPPLKEALVTQGFFLCIGISGSLRFYFVILSEAEGSSADWMRSLHCGRDDRVVRSGWQGLCGRDGTRACHPERSRRISCRLDEVPPLRSGWQRLCGRD